MRVGDIRANFKCSVADCEKGADCRGYCNNHYRRFMRCGDPLGGGAAKGVGLEFLDSVVLMETDDCILWPYGRKGPYGAVMVGDHLTGSHRYVCRKAHGDPPDESYHAAHSCRTPLCCNKRHLRWATPKENCDDRDLVHKTVAKGEKTGSVLKEKDIPMIRNLRSTGIRLKDLAGTYGVTIGAIVAVVKRKTWKHVK